MKINVILRQAFSHNQQGGNTAGIVLEQTPLPADVRQEIAARVNVSETAFVTLKPNDKTAQIAFFTPQKQIENCGHATIAAFSVLAKMRKIPLGPAYLETQNGTINRVFVAQQRVFLEQTIEPAREVQPHHLGRVLDTLSLREADFDNTPTIASAGNPFLVLPLKDEASLKKARPSRAFGFLSEEMGVVGAYLACAGDLQNGLFKARMFAPFYGITEEAATGSGAGAFAAYLAQRQPHLIPPQERLLIEQGDLMTPASASRLYAHLSRARNSLGVVRVGGQTHHKGVIKLDI